MADTTRSLAALQSLLADNTSGDISAQDARDFLVSAYKPQAITPGGRLTTESGVSVSTSERADQSTIYYTPYLHNGIGLYDGTSWTLFTFAERSLALSSLTSGKNYDVFLYDNAGTLTLELSAAWTNDTTRADALTTQDGVLVKSGATTRRYLGTIRTTDTDKTQDVGGGVTVNVGAKRYVWNLYNRVARPLAVFESADNWTYNSTTPRPYNNTSGNRVEYVVGLSLDPVSAAGCGHANNSADQWAGIGLGIDSTSASSPTVAGASAMNNAYAVPSCAHYRGHPGIGYHFVQLLEIGGASGTTNWYGDAGTGVAKSGITAEVWG